MAVQKSPNSIFRPRKQMACSPLSEKVAASSTVQDTCISTQGFEICCRGRHSTLSLSRHSETVRWPQGWPSFIPVEVSDKTPINRAF